MSRGGAEISEAGGLSEPAPTGRGRVRRWVLVAGLVGLAIATAIILYVGWDQIIAGFLKIGWRGLLALIAMYLAPIGILSAAWLVIDPAMRARLWPALYFARLVRDATGELLPFSGNVRVLLLVGV